MNDDKTPILFPTILYTVGDEELEENVKKEIKRGCGQTDTEQQRAISENILREE